MRPTKNDMKKLKYKNPHLYKIIGGYWHGYGVGPFEVIRFTT